jgi:predicted  nucleic acid-binding Zn-ribbon protein
MSLPRVPRHRPRPKLRAIPRQKSAAAAYAEMQQLAVEKQRLQQELDAIEERRLQIQERFQEINQALATLGQEAASFAQMPPATPPKPTPSRAGESFLVIDY